METPLRHSRSLNAIVYITFGCILLLYFDFFHPEATVLPEQSIQYYEYQISGASYRSHRSYENVYLVTTASGEKYRFFFPPDLPEINPQAPIALVKTAWLGKLKTIRIATTDYSVSFLTHPACLFVMALFLGISFAYRVRPNNRNTAFLGIAVTFVYLGMFAYLYFN
ncbi:hypothetical protein [Flavobacterium sp. N1719]|uniref:hypothetical protein n=1 Tax=Flavobacterium sp. N1719 TaxID=2885633 RepID=UPI002222D748|nr:hypothetical protein [Flavobacterium sp. N1719]